MADVFDALGGDPSEQAALGLRLRLAMLGYTVIGHRDPWYLLGRWRAS